MKRYSNNRLKEIGSTPKIRSFQFPRPVTEGDPVSVNCMTSHQSRFNWLKNGVSYHDQPPRISIMSAGMVSTLSIMDVSEQDQGNYTCIASSQEGSDTFTSQLVVNTKPRWLIRPQNAVMRPGFEVILDCMASGHPIPEISWWRNSMKSELLMLSFFASHQLFSLLQLTPLVLMEFTS
jgi:hypothetical protein